MTWMRLALVLSVVLLARPAWADDKDEKKGKGKGKGEAKPAVVQIDLSRLPPDLAKQLLKYAAAGDSKPEKSPPPKVKEAPKSPEPKKDKPAKVEPPKGAPGKGKAPQVQLPPGLAKKPANHPGVIHFLQHAAAQQPAQKPAPKPAKKGKD